MDIIINPIGGLANRMRAIASGISLCNKLKLNLKEIVWPVNSELYCPFDELFEPIEGTTIINISSKKQLFQYDMPRKKNLFLSGLFNINKYCGKIIDFNPAIESFINCRLHSSKPVFIQSGVIYYEFTNQLYKSLFKPKNKFLVSSKKRLLNYSDVIGIHIRRTDNSLSIKNSPIDLFYDAIEMELKKNPNVKFYLATDDDLTKLQLKKKFGNNTILCSDKSAVRDTEDGIKEALIELLTLSHCKKIYGSYWSSFSEAAAMLGNNELEIIQEK